MINKTKKTFIIKSETNSCKEEFLRDSYIGLMAFNFLSFFYLLAIGAETYSVPIFIWITRIACVPLAIWKGRLWEDKGFLILFFYFCLFSLRIYSVNPTSFFTAEGSENLLGGLWAFCGCYGLGRTLKKEDVKRFLRVISFVWIIGISIYSCIGIYVAWTDSVIPSFASEEILHLGKGYFETWHNQLNLIYSATAAGSILSISSIIAVIILVGTKSIIDRVVMSIAVLPIIIALALTDSRTAYISFPVGISIIILIIIVETCYKQKKSATFAWITGIIGMIFAFALTITILFQITPFFNNLKIRGFIPSVLAEELENTKHVMSQRGFEYSTSSLSGRYELWQEIISHFKTKPLSLFIGESKISPLKEINDYYGHCHSIYFQVILESGIPGLILILCFIGSIGKHSIKTISHIKTERWIRLLPAIPISLWIGDLAECFTWLRESEWPMVAILFIACGMIASSGSKTFTLECYNETKS